ncbi:MAG: glucuronate isomerase [Tenacibaculum sp.]
MNLNAVKTFISDNFLLETEQANILYHNYAKDLSIIDYHNHLSPYIIAKNKPFQSITKAWLQGDHYKWRAMRANGVDEHCITGEASEYKKFEKWAETVPKTLRNPLFHWTQLELKRYFNIETILDASTANKIYHLANSILKEKTPVQLLEDMKVELICTTDDPIDNLSYHKLISKSDNNIRVLPTFRSDSLFLINQKNFLDYIKKLSRCVGFSIFNLENLLEAIDKRIDFFNDNGCCISDYGIGGPLAMADFKEEEIASIVKRRLSSQTISQADVYKYRSFLLIFLGKKYSEKGWVQQYHLGAIRDNNEQLLQERGADIGCDSVGDYCFGDALSKLFNCLNLENKLPKTIAYNLNSAHNEVFASMMGNFNKDFKPSKMQWGAAWWYLDQKDGIEKHLNTLSNIGLLSNFIGMVSDSRSFLSFPRHEYFRRVLCNLIGNDIKKGLLPNDIVFFGKMVQDICYNNVKAYFNF